MSLYVDDITFTEALNSIREVSLDLNPVQCFSIKTEQDFSFIKSDLGIEINGVMYSFNDIPKLYNLMDKLREVTGLTLLVTEEYVPTEYCSGLLNVNLSLTSASETATIMRKSFFSSGIFEEIISLFFGSFLPYDGQPKSIDTIFGYLSYFDKQRMILWVAYHLIDRRRMMMASAGELMRISGHGDSCGSFINTDQNITTRVGDSFTVTESVAESGSGLDGFTSLWGDKYGYLTKLQLWIRSRLEKQFKDFSLRDNVMINQTFTNHKVWESSAWINTQNLSSFSQDLLQPDNRTTN